MKKKALAALLSLALLLALPLPASAAETTTQIYCTFSGFRTEAPPVTPAPAQPTYEVSIPAAYDTNTIPCLSITASNVDIGAGKLLTVSVDCEKTFDENGFFFLSNTERPNIKAICNLYRSDTYGTTGEWISSASTATVATFQNGATSPSSYGYLHADVSALDDTIDGTYTGTIYFKIELQDAP